MTSEKKILSIAILISAILTIVTSSLKEAHTYYHYAFFLLKPLTLILTIAFSRRLYKSFDRYHRFITIGLILCLLGDIFLMFDHIKTIYFILGLGSFLIGHIFGKFIRNVCHYDLEGFFKIVLGGVLLFYDG